MTIEQKHEVALKIAKKYGEDYNGTPMNEFKFERFMNDCTNVGLSVFYVHTVLVENYYN